MDDEPKRARLFPTTRSSAIVGARSDDPEERARSLELIAFTYWKPIYKYARFRFDKSPQEAEDITQDFFAKALERDTFAAYDPARARFRTFLRTCLDRFVIDHERARTAQKRGGHAETLDLAFDEAEHEIANAEPPDRDALAEYFEAEWMRHLLSISVETLRQECEAKGRTRHFRVFQRLHIEGVLDPPSYAAVAEELSISVTDVMNSLTYARREFRRLVLDSLRLMTGSEDEFRSEARAVLGLSNEDAPDAPDA